MTADPDLTPDQAGFALGPWRVLPDRNRLTGPGGARTLEPMGMRLLLLLARRAPQTVTRDEMVEALWQGRIVSDDAVNKQVSKVRAVLTHPRSGESLLETVAKVGVRLTVEPRVPEEVKASRRWQAAALGALALAGLAILASQSQHPQLSEEPLTSSPGAEFDPALSADGRMLAYVARAQVNARATLFVRPIESDAPQQLSPADADAAAPAWSPDGKLAFVLRRGTECRIYIRQRTGAIAPRLACVGADIGGLAWLNAHALIVSDRPGTGQSYRLSLFDFDTGEARQLTTPPAGDVGDIHPVASRDGSGVFFLRNPTVGSGGLYEVQVHDGHVERLAPDATSFTGLAIGPGDSLILSAQRGSEGPALWRYAAGKRWERLAPGAAPDIAGSADGRSFVYSRVEKQTVLWKLPLEGVAAGAALFPSTRSDWSPVISPDGRQLAFLSDRSGSEEVWMLDLRNGRARRVSDFGGPLIQDLAWSAKSDRLLTSVPRNGQFDIVEIDMATGRATPVVASPLDERHAAYASDGRSIEYVRRSGSAFVLRRYVRETGKDEALIERVMRLVPGTGETIVFTRPFASGVWVANAGGGGARMLAAYPDVTRMRDITIHGDTIYAVTIANGSALLKSIDIRTGAERVVRSLPEIARPSGIAIVGGSVIYARSLRLEADLYRLRLTN